MMQSEKGFSLVELLVAVAIIGLLAAIAIPSYARFAAKSKQSEAVVSLNNLYKSQISFNSTNDYFTNSLYQLGYTIGHAPSDSNLFCIEGTLVACGKNYSVSVTAATANTFSLEARGVSDHRNPVDIFYVFYP